MYSPSAKFCLYFGVVGALALPAPSVHSLGKRAVSTIDGSLPTTDPNTGGRLIDRPGVPTSGALSNAGQLMNYAVLHGQDAIFAKYFKPEDRTLVDNLFRKLLSPDNASGAEELANILILEGSPEPDDPAPAELGDEHLPRPLLYMDERALVYPNRDEIADPCAFFDDEGLTLDMYLLGSIILHEYMHWDWFLEGTAGGRIEDQDKGYGPEAVRSLDKSLAKYNADSYGWWATENFWAVKCGRDGGWNLPE